MLGHDNVKYYANAVVADPNIAQRKVDGGSQFSGTNWVSPGAIFVTYFE